MKTEIRFLQLITSIGFSGWGACAEADPVQGEIKEVIVAYKTHFDIGFTDSAKNVVHKYRTSFIDGALAVLEKSRQLPPEQQFIWTVPGWPMERMVEDWDGQTEERRAKLIKAFQEGRFNAHALSFTTHTESLELEELVRSLEPSIRIARLGKIDLPIAAKLSDVPSHSWIIPTLLKNAGIKFLHIGCNDASAHPQVPSLFWWEGPDGSRVLTMYSHHHYSHRSIPTDWRQPVWLELRMTGDNHGAPGQNAVAQDVERLKRAYPNARIRIGTMDDFAALALKEDLSKVPVIRGDMPDTWIHGIMADPQASASARRNRPRVPSAEALEVMMEAWGLPTVESRAARVYSQGIRFGEHTWGSHSGKGRNKFGQAWRDAREEGAFKFYESTWGEKSECAYGMTRDLNRWMSANMKTLAKGVEIDGTRVVVFNSLPHARDGLVEVTGVPRKNSVLKNLSTGAISPVETTAVGFRFLASAAPAGGYSTYVWTNPLPAVTSDLKARADGKLIENSFYRISIDPARGAITSIIDKRDRRELVDATSPHGFGQYLHERFSQTEVLSYNKAYSKGKGGYEKKYHPLINLPYMPTAKEVPYLATPFDRASLEIVETDLSISVRLTPTGNVVGHDVVTTITLYDKQPYIDLEWSIENKPAEVHPEAGWLCLPLKANSPTFRLGRLGAIIDLESDTVKGTNRNVLCLENAVAVKDGNAATCVLPLDSPLVSLEKPGIWKHEPDFVPDQANIFVNLYNNQWNTNFRLWNEGAWSSAVRVWSTSDYDDTKSLAAPSIQARVPMEAVQVDAPAGTLPVSQRGVIVSEDNIRVTALAKNPLGEGTILRIWETGGIDTTFSVSLPDTLKVTSLQPCTLRGEPAGKALTISNGRVTCRLGAYAPASYILK